MTTNEAIVEYYDRCQVHYKMHWNLEESLSLHYGYWDETTSNFHEALININRKLAEYAQIDPSDRVLDMGCGIGGSSIYLSKEIGCKCIGITLSSKQVEYATQLAKENNVTDKCAFQIQDFTNTEFDNESFDVVWAVESVCHANDKNDFLKETYRILKPGGTLVIADFFQSKNDISEYDQRIMDNWAAGWAVPFFESKDRFLSLLRQNKLSLLTYENATDNIRKSARRLYIRFFPGWLGAKIYRLFKPNSSAISMGNVWTAYYQFAGLKRGVWEYGILTAKK